MNRPTLYLDMDMVLVNLYGKLRELAGPAYLKEFDKPDWGIFSKHPDLYSTLELMPDARILYWNCVEWCYRTETRHTVQVLTALPYRLDLFPLAAAHKVEQMRTLDKNLRVCFGPFPEDKHLHVRSSRDILIDDRQSNIDQWRTAGGIGILHTSTEESLRQLYALEFA
jgi:hypothetical protein